MKFSEAILMLEQGKKIRREKWPRNMYISIDTFFQPGFISSEYLRDDWEIYEEPKKKRIVKMWPALCSSYNGGYYLTDSIYKSIEDANYGGGNRIRLATEYPPIEIQMETDE